MAGLPVAVTLHTVRNPMPREDQIVLKNIVQDSSVVIVHERLQKEILEEVFSNPGNIRVIPHGVRDIRPVPGARKLLGVEKYKTALLAGYYRPSKRFERIVNFWPEVVDRCPDALLILAGKMRNISNSDYCRTLMKIVGESPVRDNILVLRGQFPQHTFDTIISGADCMLLPYEAGAQSGILSNAAAFGVPVVTSDLESFEQWTRESGAGLSAHSDEEYVDYICQVLEDRSLQKKLKKNMKEYIRPMLWDAVSLMHHKVYNEIARNPDISSRYFYIPESPE